MPGYSQENRRIELKTVLGKDVLLFKSIAGGEGLSRTFVYAIEALAEKDKDVPFDTLLGSSVTVTLKMGRDGKESTHINGVCRAVSQGWSDADFTLFRLEIVPEFWLLTRTTQSRIFQQKSVKQILETVLQKLSPSIQLQGTYEPRDYCVQYRESDHDFACRLMEEEGIFFFFKHQDGSHKLVLGDKPSVHPTVPGPSTLTFEMVAGGYRDDDRIWGWSKTQTLRSGKVTLWDHCFELPHQHLEAQVPTLPTATVGTVSHKLKVGGNDSYELYDWPGAYAQRFDGVSPSGGDRAGDIQKIYQDNRRTTEIRMDQEASPALATRAVSNAKHLRSGHRFSMKKHPDADGDYVIVEHSCEARQTADYRSGADALEFSAAIVCQPFSLPYRPARTTPKAVVAGCQTAVVVGPSGEEIFTDKYGRVKVQFHWDREGKNDSDSSCWIRVGSIWAGKQWGAIHIPRIGQEVLVDFLEGDPDQPIVVGSVYNADMMPPNKLPDYKTQSGLQSRSTLRGSNNNFNELRFEDKKGEEWVLFHAEKDFFREVENDDDLIVGHDQTIVIKHDRMEQVEGKEEVLVCGDRDHDVEGNDGLWVNGSDGRGATIAMGDDNLLIKMGNQQTKVSMGNQTTEISMGNQETKIKMGNQSTKLDLGQATHEALQSIELKVGQSSVKIDQMGVTIKGMMVSVEGQVKTDVKGMMTTVDGSAMLRLTGGVIMIG